MASRVWMDRRVPCPRRSRAAAALLAACLGLAAPAAARLETWRQEGQAAFAKHHRTRVVLSDKGKVRLGRELVTTGPLAAGRVWDLARAADGTVYAATGDEGKVFRRPTREGAAWTVALDAADTQALTLAATPDGKVFVGTGPGGQVIDVTDPAHHASRPDPKVQYIWDLAADAQGNLYAATGPAGQLWKRTRDGKWTLLFDCKATHLLCVAVAGDGTVYAGSDGEGLIYRLNRDGKVSVAYDAPQAEVRTLLLAPDGALYAGTAADASGAGSSRGGVTLRPESTGEEAGRQPAVPVLRAGLTGEPPYRIVRTQAAAQKGSQGAAPARPPVTGSAAPKPVSAGENAVYRIEPGGVAREVFRARALIFALSWSGDHLLVGTGPEGQLYEVHDRSAESTQLAKLDTGQILSLLVEPGGAVLLGTGDPGSVVKLSAGYVAQGELISDVHDTKLMSRFGALSWRAEQPAGTSIAVQVRTGNVGEPDSTWSAWSAEQTDPASARAESPPGRFAQYRIKLTTRDPARTPELTSVALAYRSSNLPPEINRLEVPDVSAADGSARQTRLSLRWDTTDPNDDDLAFTLQVRKDGWPGWISLTEKPITEKTFTWDTTAFPSGYYRVRLSVSDRPSNRPEDAMERDRESPSFVIDHEPPTVTATPRDKNVLVSLTDALTRLVKADYALDGGPWTPLFPDDGLFDTTREQISLSLPDLKPGVHLLMIRATDAAGNLGSGDALLVVRN